MALIGSGSWRDIPNVYNAGTFSPSQMDTGFGAIVDQTGGTSWGTGAPITRAGNLDHTNFSSTPGFSNTHKQEMYSPYFLNAYLFQTQASYSGTSITSHNIHVAPLPMLVDRMTVSWGSPSAVSREFTVDLVQNGNKDNPALRWYASAVTTTRTAPTSTGVTNPVLYVNTPYTIARSAMEGPAQISAGDVLSIVTAFCPVNYVMISLACRIIHQP